MSLAVSSRGPIHNPLLAKQIAALEAGIDNLTKDFDSDEIEEIKDIGRDQYLANLRRFQTSDRTNHEW